MLTTRKTAIFSIALALFFLFSCSLKINEDSPNSAISVKTAGQSCFSETSETFSRYFEGKSQKGEMNRFFDCLQTSLNSFLTNTTGADPEAYDAKEFSRFLTHYVFKDNPLSDGLIKEILALKAAILGGNNDKITRNEFQTFLKGMEVVRTIFLMNESLFPLTTHHLEAMSREEVEQHLGHVQASINSVTEFLGSNGQVYSFDHLECFFRELFTYRKVDLSSDSDSAKIFRLIPAFGAAKAILISPPSNVVTKSDWQRLAKTLNQGASLYFHFVNHRASEVSLLSGAKSQVIVELLKEAIGIIKLGMAAHPNAIIPIEEVEAFVQALAKGNFLSQMDSDFIHTQMGLIFSSLFKYGSERNIKLGIAPGHLETILNQAEVWSESVTIADGASAALREQYYAKERFLELSETDLLTYSHLHNENSFAAAKGLRTTVAEIPMVFADLQYIRNKQPGVNQKFVIHLPASGETPINSDHLKRMGMFRAFSNLIFAFAGKSIDLPNPGNLPKENYDAVLDGIVPILIKFKLVAEDFKRSMDSRLLESALFLPHSNGDQVLDLNEALELEALLLSTVEKANLVHKEIAEGKCRLPFRDKMGEIPAFASCVKEKFLDGIAEYWSQVPKVAENVLSSATITGTDGTKFNRDSVFAILDSLTFVGRTGKPGGVKHFKADTQAWTLLPYYMDLVLKTYDVDHNDVIDLQEVMKAFPTYKQYLGKVIEGIKSRGDFSSAIIRYGDEIPLFLLILKNGKVPDKIYELNETRKLVKEFLQTGMIDPKLEISADRLRILSALNALATEMAKLP